MDNLDSLIGLASGSKLNGMTGGQSSNCNMPEGDAFKVRMVAGAGSGSNFKSLDEEFKARVVAGAGFEPAAFRL